MSSHKHIDKICVSILLFAIALTVLFMNGERFGVVIAVDEDAEAYSDSVYFTANDQDGDWDASKATAIVMDGEGCTISGQGVYAYDGNVVIAASGYYTVSGTLEDGSLIVDAEDASKIWIRLDGVTIHCSDDAAFRIDQADKVFLTLAQGTENHFSSGETYSDEALDDGTGGTVFAHDDLTINGSGSLSIEAAYKHGIDANDDLVITGGAITVDAPEDGFHVNDSMRIMDASITITAEDDGIHTDTDFVMTSGSVTIDQCYEGIEALTVDITGGTIEMYPTDDGINANGGSAEMGFGGPGGGFGGQGGMPPQDWMNADNTSDGQAEGTDTANTSDEEEEETYVHITDGTITIINKTGQDADGIDSNGDIIIDGGTIRISLPGDGGNNALDFGSESGGSCQINGGEIIACGGSAMLEEMSAESEQCSVMYNTSETVDAGTEIALKDANGGTILSYEPPCNYSSVVMSSPRLQANETYHIFVAQEEAEAVTFDETAKTAGEAQTGGMGGFGGMRPNNGQGGPRQWMQGQSAGQSGDASTGQSMDSSNAATDTDRLEQTEDTASAAANADRSDQGEDNANADQSDQTNNSGDAFGQMPQPGEFPGGFGEEQSEEETVVDTRTDIRELDADAWLMLGACAAVLIGGLAFAVIYRRRR